jgi:chemotaxis protein methyltransferase CheR
MSQTSTLHNLNMSDRTFKRLGTYIHSEFGIKMPDTKKTMLQARLQKRLRALQIASYEDYFDYVHSSEGEDEIVHMIDAVSTNKTDFFREPAHFDYLTNTALPELIRQRPAAVRRPFTFWSAGCSTGEEPYTMAMVMNEFAEQNPDFHFNILATDISATVLKQARDAVYSENSVQPVPYALRKKYLLRSKNSNKKLVRIVSQLRSCVQFGRLNFMDDSFGLRGPIDTIFCRNVIIYFDRPTQEKLLNKFYDHLVPGGYIFMGHSETLAGMDVPFVSAAPTVYRKEE